MSTDPTKMNRMNFTNANPRFSATVDNSISMYTKDIEDCMERAMGIFKQEIGECTQRAIRGLQEHIKMFVADVNDKGESLSTLPVEQSAPQKNFPPKILYHKLATSCQQVWCAVHTYHTSLPNGKVTHCAHHPIGLTLMTSKRM